MRYAVIGVLIAFVLYSTALVGVELTTWQNYVRHFFSDIEGAIPFFAVNTTLSASLLAGCSLLLVFAVACGNRPGASSSEPGNELLLSQAAMFGLLAFDDRFQVHEAIAWRIGIGDHFVMLGWAALELALLLRLCRPASIPLRCALLFCGGAALFALMMVFDAIVPPEMVLRLSIEDLAKTWGSLLFFGAGWYAARRKLGLDSPEPSLATALGWILDSANSAAGDHGARVRKTMDQA